MQEVYTPSGLALSELVLELFRVNNRMLAAGDRLVEGLELTSARWQVLGTVAAAERPQPVAWIARDMGANRQNIQRIVNDMVELGWVVFEPNPHHRRAQLVVLTPTGRQIFDQAMELQHPWINQLAHGLTLDDLAATQRVLVKLRTQLEVGS